ncbi:hypothetical protein [Gulosibacter sp. 10]|uniref:hypothetical protein n=1 Tax=Gulosibacter sp. 10 TaxID=1255570 RepID=UPI00097F3A29|nr:hypothetical protein [Gulosibacter sp. 10]SJM50877.1 hypothetical protein FM112_01655 [Gulosibacter sp. 10]
MTEKREMRAEPSADEGRTRKAALERAKATFWQSLAGSAAFAVPFGQVTTWGDLQQQAIAFAIAGIGSLTAALVAAAASYARHRGGVPERTE